MIDWYVKLKELKRMADELDRWARKAEGRQRLVLGRISDELLKFAHEVERELRTEEGGWDEDDSWPEIDLPEWLQFSDESERDLRDEGDGWEEDEAWPDVDLPEWLQYSDEDM